MASCSSSSSLSLYSCHEYEYECGLKEGTMMMAKVAVPSRHPLGQRAPELRHSHARFYSRSKLSRAYSSTGNGQDAGFPLESIDALAKVQTEKIVVLGGSGFVGSAICKAAIDQGIEVVSLSRSGRPSYRDAWVDRVLWVAGDVFEVDWDNLLNGATAVISTVGGIGTNEDMEKQNGDANIMAVNSACSRGVKKFVYVSVHDYNIPDFLTSKVGYFTGKRRAEAEVLSNFPNTGTVLRPGFIYGTRRVNFVDVPLGLIGKPVEMALSAMEAVTKPLTSLPASDLLLVPPISVEDVALASIKAVLDDDVFGIQTVEQIKDLAKPLKPQ